MPDAGGTPEAASDSDAPVMAGAEWEQIPGSSFTEPHCFMYEAKPGKVSFPQLTWTSCGDRCATDVPELTWTYAP